MRRIALISEYASPLTGLGGADAGSQNVYVGQVARRLAERGWQMDVFTRRDRPDQPEVVPLAPHAHVFYVPAGPTAPVPREKLLPFMGEFTNFVLRRCRAQGGYDLLHANFFLSALVATEVRRALRIPFVVTFHALGRVRRLHHGAADGFPPERLVIEDKAIAEAEYILAESPQDVEDLVHLYRADRSRLRIVPCGFDPDELAPAAKSGARKALGLDPDEQLILQLGRLVPHKGVDNVIRAQALLRREYGVRARLLVVGGESPEPDPVQTPEIGRLQQIAAEEGVTDAVTFVGRRGRDELRLYYGAADVFVTTPWYAPFGITPVEAMGCGRPVVGSDVGGIKATVRDGHTGFLVPPRDPAALAERLAQLLRDPRLLRSFGSNALRRARTWYTWGKVAGLVAAAYEEVLAALPVRRGSRPLSATASPIARPRIAEAAAPRLTTRS
jgi:glycosyltransferase involved in cell wall biosynthesis